MARYSNLSNIINSSDQYYNIFKDRGLSFIEQIPLLPLREPNIDFKSSVNKIPHIWASGDKYFSIAEKYYDNIRYWYLIAWYNNKPTEQHINIGEVIYIPTPLTKVLSFYNGETNG